MRTVPQLARGALDALGGMDGMPVSQSSRPCGSSTAVGSGCLAQSGPVIGEAERVGVEVRSNGPAS